MAGLILVRYGELALKSPPVRREFESRLRRNLLAQFLADHATCRLRDDHGHFYVECDDPDRSLRLVRRVFGVTSASVATECPSDRPVLEAAVLELADRNLTPGATFAVRARRTGTHPYTSQELARDLGGRILERWPERSLRVDLDHPAVELHVEVRGPRAYLYTRRESGPGGLPLGVAGPVTALVDGPRGALGAYLMMKRGCRCAVVATPPGVDLARNVLARYDPSVRIEAADDGAPAEAALATLVAETHSDAVVLPIDVDGTAPAKERWADRVVFSPTIGLEDEEVARRWADIAAVAA